MDGLKPFTVPDKTIYQLLRMMNIGTPIDPVRIYNYFLTEQNIQTSIQLKLRKAIRARNEGYTDANGIP